MTSCSSGREDGGHSRDAYFLDDNDNDDDDDWGASSTTSVVMIPTTTTATTAADIIRNEDSWWASPVDVPTQPTTQQQQQQQQQVACRRRRRRRTPYWNGSSASWHHMGLVLVTFLCFATSGGFRGIILPKSMVGIVAAQAQDAAAIMDHHNPSEQTENQNQNIYSPEQQQQPSHPNEPSQEKDNAAVGSESLPNQDRNNHDMTNNNVDNQQNVVSASPPNNNNKVEDDHNSNGKDNNNGNPAAAATTIMDSKDAVPPPLPENDSHSNINGVGNAGATPEAVVSERRTTEEEVQHLTTQEQNANVNPDVAAVQEDPNHNNNNNNINNESQQQPQTHHHHQTMPPLNQQGGPRTTVLRNEQDRLAFEQQKQLQEQQRKDEMEKLIQEEVDEFELVDDDFQYLYETDKFEEEKPEEEEDDDELDDDEEEEDDKEPIYVIDYRPGMDNQYHPHQNAPDDTDRALYPYFLYGNDYPRTNSSSTTTAENDSNSTISNSTMNNHVTGAESNSSSPDLLSLVTNSSSSSFDVKNRNNETATARMMVESNVSESTPTAAPTPPPPVNLPARVVEFYAVWCPHCLHFRQHYLDVAKQVHDLLAVPSAAAVSSGENGTETKEEEEEMPLVQFYGIACNVYKPICRRFGIAGFPQIRVFKANSTEVFASIDYPNLHAFDILTALDIRIPDKNKLKLFNSSDSSNRLSTMKDFQKKTKHKEDEKKAELARTKDNVFEDAYLSFLYTLRNNLYNAPTTTTSTNTTNTIPGTNGTMKTVTTITHNKGLDEETAHRFEDWVLLLRRTMPPTWHKMQHLLTTLVQNMDRIVQSERNLIEVLDGIMDTEEDGDAQESSEGDEEDEARRKKKKKNKKKKDNNKKKKKKHHKFKWSPACTKGNPGAGYTCGLWQLFHIMTVGVVEFNAMIVDDSSAHLIISTAHAAEYLRNFIESFFACNECRMNFVTAFDACSMDRCNRLVGHIQKRKPRKLASTTEDEEEEEDEDEDEEEDDDVVNSYMEDWIELPLWLFETHNAVNARLLRERAEREHWSHVLTHHDEILSQWPPATPPILSDGYGDLAVEVEEADLTIPPPWSDSCPQCWRMSDRTAWDAMTMYKFLRTQYWPDDEVNEEYQLELFDLWKKQEGLATEETSDSSSKKKQEERGRRRRRLGHDGGVRDDDDDTMAERNDWITTLLGIVVSFVLLMAAIMAVAELARKREMSRTGRHKRVE